MDEICEMEEYKMDNITVMENPKFGQVRKVLVDGEWMYAMRCEGKAN